MFWPIRGYGNPQEVFLSRHILYDRLLYAQSPDDSLWTNVRAMLSRFVSTAIPEVRVEITVFGKKQRVMTDDAGLFLCRMQLAEPLAPGWYNAQYCVDNPLQEGPEELKAENEILIVDEDAEFGIISDVDDTIIISHPNRTFRKLRLVLS